jgi:DNA-binding MltR family transcriptional regulator
MRLNPNSAEGRKRMLALIEEIEEQTDRGVAIVGAAWVEEAMTAAIESLLHSDNKAWSRLFSGNGPLSTFSAKTDLCSLLGLVSATIKSDLHIIREIRNEFAHQIVHRFEHTKLSFVSPHINDKCKALKCIAHEDILLSRTAFVRACATLSSDFELLIYAGNKLPDLGQVITRTEMPSQAS